MLFFRLLLGKDWKVVAVAVGGGGGGAVAAAGRVVVQLITTVPITGTTVCGLWGVQLVH